MADFALLDQNDNGITLADLAKVPPGSSYRAVTGGPLTIKIKNITGNPQINHLLSAINTPPYTIAGYVRFSLNAETFAPGPLELGPFALDETKTVYVDIELPAGAVGGNNQRCDLSVDPTNA